MEKDTDTWKELFAPPRSDVLVKTFSYFFYQGNFRAEGKLYVSNNLICFCSNNSKEDYKVVIELKDVKSICERPKRIAPGRTIDIIVNISNSDTKHMFSTFSRKTSALEVMQHCLKNFMEKELSSIYGASRKISKNELSATSNISENVDTINNMNIIRNLPIPMEEKILDHKVAVCHIEALSPCRGDLYLTDLFVCFQSHQDYSYLSFSIPYFCISTASFDSERVFPLFTIETKFKTFIKLELFVTANDTNAYSTFVRNVLDRLEKTQQSGIWNTALENIKKSVPLLLMYNRPLQDFVGLGYKHGFVPNLEEDKPNKVENWKNMYKICGCSLYLVRSSILIDLIKRGMPNFLRGDMWEVCSGSIYYRFKNPEYYDKLHSESHDRTLANEEIDKDLERTFPEHPAYQTKEGISSLCRVLYAFSWHRPDIGYCQSMNTIVGCFLIFLSEEQSFWLLSTLSEKQLKGYYCKHMAGGLTDSAVVIILMEKYMPMLYRHLVENSMNISIIITSWFLMLYFGCFPFNYTLRILDCFFVLGHRVLFQLCLAIFKVNAEGILNSTDEGEVAKVLKDYFQSFIIPSGFSKSQNLNVQLKFSAILNIAFNEFFFITNEKIDAIRLSQGMDVIHDLINNSGEYSVVNKLSEFTRFTLNQLNHLFNVYHSQLSENPEASEYTLKPNRKKKNKQLIMGCENFNSFLERILALPPEEKTKAGNTNSLTTMYHSHRNIENFSREAFKYFAKNSDYNEGISFDCLIRNLEPFIFSDFMQLLEHIFDIHDNNEDGILENEEITSIILTINQLTFFRLKDATSMAFNYMYELIKSTEESEIHQEYNSKCESNNYLQDSSANKGIKLIKSVFRAGIISRDSLVDYFSGNFQQLFVLDVPNKTASVIDEGNWKELAAGIWNLARNLIPKFDGT